MAAQGDDERSTQSSSSSSSGLDDLWEPQDFDSEPQRRAETQRQGQRPRQVRPPVARPNEWSPGHDLSRAFNHQSLDYVVLIQRRLNELGYGPIETNGHFGPVTEAAVIQYQADEWLPPNGRVGPETWARLFNIVLGQWNPEGWIPETPRISGYGSGGGAQTPSNGQLRGVPSAICSDGSFSYSQNRSGTCSSHGGVGTWTD